MRLLPLIPFLLWSLSCFADMPDSAKETELNFHCTIKAEVKTKKNTSISAPGISLPITYIIPDGSAVTKGQILCLLDERESLERLNDLRLTQKQAQLKALAKVTSINNEIHILNDELAKNKDSLAIKKATLKKKLSLPDMDEVTIAKGKWRVALLEAQASEKEFIRGQNRLKRQMISTIELDKIKRENESKKLKLKAAELELQLSQLPATKSSIQQTRYEIQSLEKEEERILFKLKNKSELSKDRIKAAKREEGRIEKELLTLEENIKNTTTKAPQDGFIQYKAAFAKGQLSPGKYISPSAPFLQMPDLKTLYFEGLLLEKHRPFIHKGSPAKVYLANSDHLPIDAEVSTISTRSFDLGQTLKRQWGKEHDKTGIIVYKITFKLNRYDDSLRPGMHARITITPRAQKFPAVAIEDISLENEKIQLHKNGIDYSLEGLPWEGKFFISKSIKTKKTTVQEAQDVSGSQTISGEVKALQETQLYLPRMKQRSVRLNQLTAEEKIVKKGELVAKFDQTEINKRISDEENRLAQDRLNRKEKEEAWLVKQNENNVKLLKAQNNYRIKLLKEKDSLNIIDSKKLISNRLNKALAQIELNGKKEEVIRQENSRIALMSPLQLKKLKRDLERKKLLLEKEELNLKTTLGGKAITDKSKSTLERVEAESEWQILKEKTKMEIRKAANDFKTMKFSEEKRSKQLKKLLSTKEKLTLFASADGMITYPEAYISGELKKPAQGDTLYRGSHVMSIVDTDSFVIRASVPEALLPQINKGMQLPLRLPFNKGKALIGEVTSTGILFEPRLRQNKFVGLYSSHEPLGESVFKVDITLKGPERKKLKPGMPVRIEIPLNGSLK